MNFKEIDLKGAFIIEFIPFEDHRGIFSRTFCANEFKEHGLRYNMVQSNLSRSFKKGTLRGMHFQIDGAEEAKLIRCIKGSILDVIIDIRTSSKTFGEYYKIELTEDCNKMIYVPEGFAHGFLTLSDSSEIFYQVSNFYTPNKEGGIRWDDPFFNIDWGLNNPIISKKDAAYPNFKID